MTEIGFYHLTRTGPEQALPQLLGRTLAAGERAAVMCGSEARVAELDAALWLCPDPDWLPHGTAAMGMPELQPIWLATDDAAPNGARFLFTLDGVASTPARRVRPRVRPVRWPRRKRGGCRPRALVGGQGGGPRPDVLAAGRARVGEEGVNHRLQDGGWREGSPTRRSDGGHA